MASITVVPAYGRDYHSLKAAMTDWYAGKDFMIISVFNAETHGTYVNANDLPEGTEVRIRYSRMRKVVEFTT